MARRSQCYRLHGESRIIVYYVTAFAQPWFHSIAFQEPLLMIDALSRRVTLRATTRSNAVKNDIRVNVTSCVNYIRMRIILRRPEERSYHVSWAVTKALRKRRKVNCFRCNRSAGTPRKHASFHTEVSSRFGGDSFPITAGKRRVATSRDVSCKSRDAVKIALDCWLIICSIFWHMLARTEMFGGKITEIYMRVCVC